MEGNFNFFCLVLGGAMMNGHAETESVTNASETSEAARSGNVFDDVGARSRIASSRLALVRVEWFRPASLRFVSARLALVKVEYLSAYCAVVIFGVYLRYLLIKDFTINFLRYILFIGVAIIGVVIFTAVSIFRFPLQFLAWPSYSIITHSHLIQNLSLE